MTRWAKDVAPDKTHLEYPRPQLVRSEWTNLNGLWEYAILPRGENHPAHYHGSILVPFPVESALSGVMQRLGPEKSLWYRRRFTVPAAWRGQQVLLHFEAVDWETRVWIDGKELTTSDPHRGGYSPFAFDITDTALAGSEHELVVGVLDPSDAGKQPCGKQHNKPEGIWYTPSSGIWQTVWLEPVPKTRIASVRFESDISKNQVHGIVQASAAAGNKLPDDLVADVMVTAPRIPTGSAVAASAPIVHASGPLDDVVIDIPRGETTQTWSPEHPYLYDVVVRLTDKNGTQVYDEVKSYFAFRTIGVSRARRGNRPRILLNGHPIFLLGPLDQGFWPDGLYTAPTDEALRSDLETTKRLGFNFVRKHVKVEPARWYYWCDRLGLAVFQDMPSGDGYAKWPADGVELHRTPESAANFEHELRDVIEAGDSFRASWAGSPSTRVGDNTTQCGSPRWSKASIRRDWSTRPAAATISPPATSAIFTPIRVPGTAPGSRAGRHVGRVWRPRLARSGPLVARKRKAGDTGNMSGATN